MQTSLFEPTEKHQPKNTLIITTKKQKALNKQQQDFNRLIKKIEKLRKEIEKTSADLDKELDFYGKNMYPLEQQLAILRKEVVKLLFPFYNTKKTLLPKAQKEKLKFFLSIQLKEIFIMDGNEPDEELKEIFKKVNGLNYEEAAHIEFEEAKDEMEAMLESFGFDVNFDGFEKDMSPEEMMAKMKDMEEEFLSQQKNMDSKKSARKKTAKQLQKEEKERKLEEARNKNISSIYKQLAKALHPDLEQDENLKMEKEILMKRLTVAYNNQDLHSMLSLEMEWIHKEEENTDELSNEKLAIYNQVLKEQVQELEEQKFALMEHPRFYPLRRYYAFSFIDNNINLPTEKRKLEETLRTIKKSIANLKGKGALTEVRNIINELDRFDLLDNLIENYEWD